MHFNKNEIINLSYGTGDHEGYLHHKVSSPNYHESKLKIKWFKLSRNMLFYYNVNDNGIKEEQPTGLYILENSEVHDDVFGIVKNTYSFSLTWKGDEKKYTFFTQSENACTSWLEKLKKASCDALWAILSSQRLQIISKGGKDPFLYLDKRFFIRFNTWKNTLKLSNSSFYDGTKDADNVATFEKFHFCEGTKSFTNASPLVTKKSSFQSHISSS